MIKEPSTLWKVLQHFQAIDMIQSSCGGMVFQRFQIFTDWHRALTYCGKDNGARSGDIKTTDGVFKRSAAILAKLDLALL